MVNQMSDICVKKGVGIIMSLFYDMKIKKFSENVLITMRNIKTIKLTNGVSLFSFHLITIYPYYRLIITLLWLILIIISTKMRGKTEEGSYIHAGAQKFSSIHILKNSNVCEKC